MDETLNLLDMPMLRTIESTDSRWHSQLNTFNERKYCLYQGMYNNGLSVFKHKISSYAKGTTV
jgi:hypothetical protein